MPEPKEVSPSEAVTAYMISRRGDCACGANIGWTACNDVHAPHGTGATACGICGRVHFALLSHVREKLRGAFVF